MASLTRVKVHNQSGSYRLRLPIEWVHENVLESKDTLDVIVSTNALVVLPKRELNQSEIDEIIQDLKQLMPARKILMQAASSEIREKTQNTTKCE